MIKKLYHGTNTLFTEFGNDYLCTEKSIDQYGSGFYFYSNPSKTVLHGSLRIYANVDINNCIEWDTKYILNRDIVTGLILCSPNIDNRLLDHGDIEWEGFDNVLEKAIDCYCGIDFLDCLNTIGNDFFNGDETYILLNKFIELTGIDCITDTKRDIYVVLSKKQIDIEMIEDYETESLLYQYIK